MIEKMSSRKLRALGGPYTDNFDPKGQCDLRELKGNNLIGLMFHSELFLMRITNCCQPLSS